MLGFLQTSRYTMGDEEGLPEFSWRVGAQMPDKPAGSSAGVLGCRDLSRYPTTEGAKCFLCLLKSYAFHNAL